MDTKFLEGRFPKLSGRIKELGVEADGLGFSQDDFEEAIHRKWFDENISTMPTPVKRDYALRDGDSRRDLFQLYVNTAANKTERPETTIQYNRSIGKSDSDYLLEEMAAGRTTDIEDIGFATEAARAVGRGVLNTTAMFNAAGAAGYDIIGWDAMRDLATDTSSALTQFAATELPGTVSSIYDVNAIGNPKEDLLRWAIGMAGEQAPLMGSIIASGGLGALAHGVAKKQVGKALIKKYGANYLKDVGKKAYADNALLGITKHLQTAAGLGAGGMLETGSVYMDIFEKTGKHEGGTALAYGMAAGMLEALPLVAKMEKILGPGAASGLIPKIAKALDDGNVYKRIAKGMTAEAATEGIQTIIERAAVKHIDENREIFSAEGIEEMTNAMAGGALMGGGVGALNPNILGKVHGLLKEDAEKIKQDKIKVNEMGKDGFPTLEQVEAPAPEVAPEPTVQEAAQTSAEASATAPPAFTPTPIPEAVAPTTEEQAKSEARRAAEENVKQVRADYQSKIAAAEVKKVRDEMEGVSDEELQQQLSDELKVPDAPLKPRTREDSLAAIADLKETGDRVRIREAYFGDINEDAAYQSKLAAVDLTEDTTVENSIRESLAKDLDKMVPADTQKAIRKLSAFLGKAPSKLKPAQILEKVANTKFADRMKEAGLTFKDIALLLPKYRMARSVSMANLKQRANNAGLSSTGSKLDIAGRIMEYEGRKKVSLRRAAPAIKKKPDIKSGKVSVKKPAPVVEKKPDIAPVKKPAPVVEKVVAEAPDFTNTKAQRAADAQAKALADQQSQEAEDAEAFFEAQDAEKAAAPVVEKAPVKDDAGKKKAINDVASAVAMVMTRNTTADFDLSIGAVGKKFKALIKKYGLTAADISSRMKVATLAATNSQANLQKQATELGLSDKGSKTVLAERIADAPVVKKKAPVVEKKAPVVEKKAPVEKVANPKLDALNAQLEKEKSGAAFMEKKIAQIKANTDLPPSAVQSAEKALSLHQNDIARLEGEIAALPAEKTAPVQEKKAPEAGPIAATDTVEEVSEKVEQSKKKNGGKYKSSQFKAMARSVIDHLDGLDMKELAAVLKQTYREAKKRGVVKAIKAKDAEGAKATIRTLWKKMKIRAIPSGLGKKYKSVKALEAHVVSLLRDIGFGAADRTSTTTHRGVTQELGESMYQNGRMGRVLGNLAARRLELVEMVGDPALADDILSGKIGLEDIKTIAPGVYEYLQAASAKMGKTASGQSQAMGGREIGKAVGTRAEQAIQFAEDVKAGKFVAHEDNFTGEPFLTDKEAGVPEGDIEFPASEFEARRDKFEKTQADFRVTKVAESSDTGKKLIADIKKQSAEKALASSDDHFIINLAYVLGLRISGARDVLTPLERVELIDKIDAAVKGVAPTSDLDIGNIVMLSADPNTEGVDGIENADEKTTLVVNALKKLMDTNRALFTGPTINVQRIARKGQKGIRAFYDAATGEMTIIVENLKEPNAKALEDAVRAIVYHEDMIHGWIKTADPELYNKITDQIKAGKFAREEVAEIKKLAEKFNLPYVEADGTLTNRGVEEALAEWVSGAGVRELEASGIGRKMRNLVRRVGISDYTDIQARDDMVGAMEKYLSTDRTKRAAPTGSGHVFSIDPLDDTQRHYSQMHSRMARVLSKFKTISKAELKNIFNPNDVPIDPALAKQTVLDLQKLDKTLNTWDVTDAIAGMAIDPAAAEQLVKRTQFRGKATQNIPISELMTRYKSVAGAETDATIDGRIEALLTKLSIDQSTIDKDQFLGELRNGEHQVKIDGTFKRDDTTPFWHQLSQFRVPGQILAYSDMLSEGLFDRYSMLRRLSDIMKNTAGLKYKQDIDAYVTEELTYSKISNGVQKVEDKFIRPLIDGMKANKLDFDTMNDIATDMHASERDELMERKGHDGPNGSGWFQEDKDRLAEYKKANPKQYAKAVKLLEDHLFPMLKSHREFLVSSGMNTQEQVNQMEADYKHYVPLRGVADPLEDFNFAQRWQATSYGEVKARNTFGASGSKSLSPTYTPRAGGRTTRAADPVLQSAWSLYANSIHDAERMKVITDLMETARNNPDDTFWTQGSANQRLVYDSVTGERTYTSGESMPIQITKAEKELARAKTLVANRMARGDSTDKIELARKEVTKATNELAKVMGVKEGMAINKAIAAINEQITELKDTGGSEKKIENREKKLVKLGERFAALSAANPDLKEDILLQESINRELDYLGRIFQAPLAEAMKSAEDTVWAVKDGRIMFLKIPGNVKLAQQLKGAGAGKLWWIAQMVGKLTRKLSSVMTSHNPYFFFTNIQRDIGAALFNVAAEIGVPGAGWKISKSVPSAMAEIFRAEAGLSVKNVEMRAMYDSFREEGGDTSFQSMTNIKESKKNWDDALKQKGAPRKMFDVLWNGIEHVNKAAEAGTRLATYKFLTESNTLNKREAASYAKNLTVNFNRAGTWAPLMNSMYMFFNASMQGMGRTGSLLKNSPKKRLAMLTAKTMVAGSALGFINRLFLGEDDDGQDKYDKVPDYITNNSMLVPAPGFEGYLRLRLPYIYNIPYALGVIMERTIAGNRSIGQSAGAIMEVGMDSFNPLGTVGGTPGSFVAQSISPSITDPLVQVVLNENFFGGHIRPENNPFAPRPHADQYSKHVNPLIEWAAKRARAGAEAVGIDTQGNFGNFLNPADWEHLLKSYTGGVTKFGSDIINTGEGMLVGAEGGAEIRETKIPFVGQSLAVPSKYVDREEYAENRNRINNIHRTFKTLTGPDAIQFRKERGQELRLYQRLKGRQRAIDKQSKRIKRVYDTIDRVKSSQAVGKHYLMADKMRERKDKLMREYSKAYREGIK